jgi:hypothetical protein
MWKFEIKLNFQTNVDDRQLTDNTTPYKSATTILEGENLKSISF